MEMMLHSHHRHKVMSHSSHKFLLDIQDFIHLCSFPHLHLQSKVRFLPYQVQHLWQQGTYCSYSGTYNGRFFCPTFAPIQTGL